MMQAAVKDEPLELLGRIANGDEKAMKLFFDSNANTVYRYVLTRANDAVMAADVLNDVMLEVWKNPDRFEGRSALSTWLIGIARYKMIDRFRAQKRNDHDELDEQFEDELATDVPMQQLDNERHAGFINKCMEQLSDNHREIVHLTFFEDMAYPEIAEVLACSVGTVKSRMFHAKEKLKQCVARLSQGGLGYE